MIEETKTDEWGKWLKSPKGSWILIEMSQKYIDERLIPRQEEALVRSESEEHQIKVSKRMTRLGESRAYDPDKIAVEDQILDKTTSTINTAELDKIVSKLEFFGDMTLAELNDYFKANSTTAADLKKLMKRVYFALWGTLNLVRILANRELPPEE